MRSSFILFAVLLISACGHHRDVRPGASGQHKVVVRDSTAEGSNRNALNQAKHFCKQSEKHAAIVSEKTDYTGSMDENTRKTVNQASKAAVIVGGTTAGVTRHQGAGAVLGTAGTVGSIMTSGDDYLTEMTFVCN
jgi:hypothetical protein